MADGHGRWPGIARPFRAIEGTNQGGKRGKSKTKERGLIPPINFGISRLNRADLGEEMARFTGEREEAGRLEVEDDPTGGTRAPACGTGAHARGTSGWLGSASGQEAGGAAWARRRRGGSVPAHGEGRKEDERGREDFSRGPREGGENFGLDSAQRRKEGLLLVFLFRELLSIILLFFFICQPFV